MDHTSRRIDNCGILRQISVTQQCSRRVQSVLGVDFQPLSPLLGICRGNEFKHRQIPSIANEDIDRP